MSQQSPFAVPSGTTGPLYRRKRVFFMLVIGLVTLFFFLRTSSFTHSATLKIDELNGLLYMVAHTEQVLPHGLDTSAPIAPAVWVPGESFNSKVWSERTTKLDQTPIIVFSKSYCP
jgi:hypothetical protein